MTHYKAPWGKFLILMAVVTSSWCQASDKDQIVFLHLKLKGQEVTLVDSSVRPGRYKTVSTPDKKGVFYLELVSTNGTTIWSDVMADPAFRRHEYEDPDHPGSILVKEVALPEAEFTVRVPFHKTARKLKLFRLDKLSNRVEAALPGRRKQGLGSVAVPALEMKP